MGEIMLIIPLKIFKLYLYNSNHLNLVYETDSVNTLYISTNTDKEFFTTSRHLCSILR